METTEDITDAEAIAHAAATTHGPLFIDLTGLARTEFADGGVYRLRGEDFAARLIAKAERHTGARRVLIAWDHNEANLMERGNNGRNIGRWLDEEISEALCDPTFWDFTDGDEEE